MSNAEPYSEGSRFASVTPDNHSAWIWLPALLGLANAFIFLILRLIVKRNRYSWDDAVLGVGYVRHGGWNSLLYPPN
jgi:hypothetical protein